MSNQTASGDSRLQWCAELISHTHNLPQAWTCPCIKCEYVNNHTVKPWYYLAPHLLDTFGNSPLKRTPKTLFWTIRYQVSHKADGKDYHTVDEDVTYGRSKSKSLYTSVPRIEAWDLLLTEITYWFASYIHSQNVGDKTCQTAVDMVTGSCGSDMK